MTLWNSISRWKVSAVYSYPSGATTIGSDGLPVEASTSTQDIIITAPQPLRPRDVEILDEGEKIRDHWITWTNISPPMDVSTKLIYRSVTYKIVSIDDRTDTNAGAYKLVIKKENYN